MYFLSLAASEFPKFRGTGASGELLNSGYLVILLPSSASFAGQLTDISFIFLEYLGH